MAYPEDDGVMILSTDQSAYDTQHETMGMLGLPGLGLLLLTRWLFA